MSTNDLNLADLPKLRFHAKLGWIYFIMETLTKAYLDLLVV